MKYAIMTSRGFQLRGAEAAVYDSHKEAIKHMAPGDTLVPIQSDAVIFGARTKQQTEEHGLRTVLGMRSKT